MAYVVVLWVCLSANKKDDKSSFNYKSIYKYFTKDLNAYSDTSLGKFLKIVMEKMVIWLFDRLLK